MIIRPYFVVADVDLLPCVVGQQVHWAGGLDITGDNFDQPA